MVLQTTTLQAEFLSATATEKFTTGDRERFVRILSYTLFWFDSLQVSPIGPAFALSTGGVSRDLSPSR
jgi:hypothetical protein